MCLTSAVSSSLFFCQFIIHSAIGHADLVDIGACACGGGELRFAIFHSLPPFPFFFFPLILAPFIISSCIKLSFLAVSWAVCTPLDDELLLLPLLASQCSLASLGGNLSPFLNCSSITSSQEGLTIFTCLYTKTLQKREKREKRFKASAPGGRAAESTAASTVAASEVVSEWVNGHCKQWVLLARRFFFFFFLIQWWPRVCPEKRLVVVECVKGMWARECPSLLLPLYIIITKATFCCCCLLLFHLCPRERVRVSAAHCCETCRASFSFSFNEAADKPITSTTTTTTATSAVVACICQQAESWVEFVYFLPTRRRLWKLNDDDGWPATQLHLWGCIQCSTDKSRVCFFLLLSCCCCTKNLSFPLSPSPWFVCILHQRR